MLTGLTSFVRDAVAAIDPETLFECDEAHMMNVKVDSITRHRSFVWLEEPTTSSITLHSRLHRYSRPIHATRAFVYFCRFEPMHNDAYKGDTGFSEDSGERVPKRIVIRDGILRDLVYPFIKALGDAGFAQRYPDLYESIRVTYPRSRFDGNEVSVCVEFDYIELLPC